MLIMSPRWTQSKKENLIIFRSDERQINIKHIKDADSITELLSCRPIPYERLPHRLIKYLIESGVIIEQNALYTPPSNLERQLEYLGAFRSNPETLIEDLRKVKVCIIGIGGIGSVVLEILSGCGVENFLLIDNDTVDLSNLNRQFIYTPSQVGLPKTKAANIWLNKNRPWVKAEVIHSTYPSKAIIRSLSKGIDFVVGAFDHPTISNTISLISTCWQRKVTSAFAMTGITKNLISPVFYSRLSNNSPESAFKIESMRNQPPIKASSGTTNTLTASILAEQILFHLTGIHEEVEYHQSTIVQRKNGNLVISQHNQITL
ncbi:MAG TPA: ThiF family adenylyltransferase [Pseudomonas sp.]